MKLLLVKLGKAWNVLKRDGFLVGSKRVGRAFFQLFRRVTPGEVLFVSNGVGDSARYRTVHVAEMLEQAGFRTAVTVQDNPFLLSYRDKFSVFVFHRVLYTAKVRKFLELLKHAKKTIIFETDDLVYDPEFLQHMDYYAKMNSWEKKLYEHGLGGEILMDPAVAVATTTTRFLADKLREKGKKVFIVPNKLSKQDVVWAEQALQNKPRREDGVVRVGYLSGTPSHNKDFATITEVLVQLLQQYTELRLVLVGPLDTASALNHYADRIERLPFVPREELFQNIATLDINLAPLEIGNPFCESKSELKFFEAGIVGVPTVAAATDTFRRAMTDGVDGSVAATPLEWQTKLTRLIEDKNWRMSMGQKARVTALERYTTKKALDEEYITYLRSRVDQSTTL